MKFIEIRSIEVETTKNEQLQRKCQWSLKKLRLAKVLLFGKRQIGEDKIPPKIFIIKNLVK